MAWRCCVASEVMDIELISSYICRYCLYFFCIQRTVEDLYTTLYTLH